MNKNDNSTPERDRSSGLERSIEKASGRKEPELPPSVIEHIGEVTGKAPKVSLRETDEQGYTPMLKPLAPDDERDTGKYIVQGELGRGGVGAVHRGHDQDLGRDVAMKFLHEKYKDEPSILHRFVEEAQIGGQLQHPGIVPVYDLGMSDGNPFFAMKLVKGKTLAQAMAERESVADDRRRFLAIFEQVCQTMAYAHVRGVVHRDLKPSNIMIGSFGEVQVVDWGMGKVLQRGGVADEKRATEKQAQMSIIETVRSAGHGTQSIMGSVMGTPAYMPPEQARGDVDTMDARSDVFALGAILCEILTGQPPYVGEQSELIRMAAMAKLDDAHVRLQGCGASDDLIELTTRCLMPASAARPQSAEDVAKVVHDHLGAAERRAHEATVRAVALRRAQKLGIALAVVFAAGLAVSVWFWQAAADSARSEQTAAKKEKEARELADTREQEAAIARDLAQANLDNFNRLSHVVLLETARTREKTLYPAWPSNSDKMRTWLDDMAMKLTAALPELSATLTVLEARGNPPTDAEKADARRKYPRHAELTLLETKLAALQDGTTEPDEYSASAAALEDEIAPAAGSRGEKALVDLRAEVADLHAELSRRTAWHFEDEADRFLHSTLRQLAADIEAFERREVAAMRQRLAWSEQVEKLTIIRFDAKWNEARLAILKADGVTASKLYGAVPIELTPQMGLIPIGMNPVTKLWEFYHLRSAWDGAADPAALAVPTHREDGSIQVLAETGIVFVLLPGGEFTEGAQNTDPTGPNYDEHHESAIEPYTVEVEPFLLARHELTQGQWARLWNGEEDMRRPSFSGTDTHPVERVSCDVSSRLCDWHRLALPNDSQWEYGCRGMTTTPYSFDFAEFKDFANIRDAAWTVTIGGDGASWSDGHFAHAPVGTFRANPFGLHDMHGNVNEWSPILGDSNRTFRGGSFASSATHARSAQGNKCQASYTSDTVGLRAARALQ